MATASRYSAKYPGGNLHASAISSMGRIDGLSRPLASMLRWAWVMPCSSTYGWHRQARDSSTDGASISARRACPNGCVLSSVNAATRRPPEWCSELQPVGTVI
jgi:hypothetical protein